MCTGIFNYLEYLPRHVAALTDKNNEREQIETSRGRKLDGGETGPRFVRANRVVFRRTEDGSIEIMR